jgi:hypothetical protein
MLVIRELKRMRQEDWLVWATPSGTVTRRPVWLRWSRHEMKTEGMVHVEFCGFYY